MNKKLYHYKDVFEGKEIAVIEADADERLTEVDKIFAERTGRKATERGITVWWNTCGGLQHVSKNTERQ